MTLLVHLIRQSFNSVIKNKNGSSYIEASIAMPLACIISIMMLQLGIVFFNDLIKQTEEHKEYLDKTYGVLYWYIMRNLEYYNYISEDKFKSISLDSI